MSTPEFQDFLTKLKEEAEPKEFALAKIRHVEDATVCHGFGALCMPVIREEEIIGVLKDKDAIMPRILHNGLVSAIESIFGDNCRVEDDDSGRYYRSGKWVKPADSKEFSVLTESNIAISPKSKLDVVRVQSKEELSSDMWTRQNQFRERVDKSEFHVNLSELIRRDRGVSWDEFSSISKNIDMTVYLGKEGIIEYLVATKEPLNLIRVLYSLRGPPVYGVTVPMELYKKAATEAEKRATSFYEKADLIFEKEKQFAKDGILRHAASGGGTGVITEKNTPVVDIEKDSAKFLTYWQADELRKNFNDLSSKAKELRELGVLNFQTTLKPEPWKTIELNVLFNHVNRRASKYEALNVKSKEKTA